MQIKAWVSDAAGVKLFDDNDYDLVNVTSFDAATASLASDLVNTASDEFLTAALRMWFTDGKVTQLDEGNGHFWNFELVE